MQVPSLNNQRFDTKPQPLPLPNAMAQLDREFGSREDWPTLRTVVKNYLWTQQSRGSGKTRLRPNETLSNTEIMRQFSVPGYAIETARSAIKLIITHELKSVHSAYLERKNNIRNRQTKQAHESKQRQAAIEGGLGLQTGLLMPSLHSLNRQMSLLQQIDQLKQQQAQANTDLILENLSGIFSENQKQRTRQRKGLVSVFDLPFTLEQYNVARHISSSTAVLLTNEGAKQYDALALPRLSADKLISGTEFDISTLPLLSEEEIARIQAGPHPRFIQRKHDPRTLGQKIKEEMLKTSEFYKKYYAGRENSPYGRAYGSFVSGLVNIPLGIAESIEFLSDPDYRKFVNPDGTSFGDYLGAVTKLALELGVINVEAWVLKAGWTALKTLFKNVGRKISAKFAEDGMEHAVANNIGKRIDEAFAKADEVELQQAAAPHGGNGGKTPRTRRDIDDEINSIISARSVRRQPFTHLANNNFELDDLIDFLSVGNLLFSKNILKYRDWAPALTKRLGYISQTRLRIIFRRIKRGGNQADMLDDLSDMTRDINQEIIKDIKITGDELGLNLDAAAIIREARNLARTLAGRVVMIADDLRVVELTGVSARKSVGTVKKALIVPRMEDLIRSAKYLRSGPDYKKRTTKIIVHYYKAKVLFKGKLEDVNITIREEVNGDFYYDWNV